MPETFARVLPGDNRRAIMLPVPRVQPYMGWYPDMDFDAHRDLAVESFEGALRGTIALVRSTSEGDQDADDAALAHIFAHILQLATEESIQDGVEICAEKSGLKTEQRAADRHFRLFRAMGNPMPRRGV